MNPLAQALVQRGGYNQTDAINASQGPRAAELAREFGVSEGGGQALGGQTQAISQSNGAVGQANNMLQNTYGMVQQGLSDVKSRYSQLLGEIKGQAGQDVASEFGRRGIPTSSGIVQQAQGRETARRSSEALVSQTNAEYPFYSLLSSLGINQANAMDGAATSGVGGIDWGSEFSDYVGNSVKPAQTTTNNAQGIKLNQSNTAQISSKTPKTIQPYSPLQQLSTAIFNPLARIQQAVPGIVNTAKTALTSQNPLLNLFRPFGR